MHRPNEPPPNQWDSCEQTRILSDRVTENCNSNCDLGWLGWLITCAQARAFLFCEGQKTALAPPAVRAPVFPHPPR